MKNATNGETFRKSGEKNKWKQKRKVKERKKKDE